MLAVNKYLPVHLLALIAGGLACLALAPFSWWPLALLSVLIFYGLLYNADTLKRSLSIGFAYGAGYFLFGISWVYVSMVDHAATPVLLAAAFTLLFCLGLGLFYVLLAFLYHRYMRRLPVPLIIIAFASLWVLLDFIRAWLFTGFPWLYLGYSGLDNWLAGYGPVVGQHGITFLIVLTSLCLFYALKQPRHVILPTLLWVGGLALQTIDWTEPSQQRQITLLQGNVDLATKWQLQQLNESLEYYFSRTYAHLDSDLIIWPETAAATYWDNVQPAAEALSDLAASQNTVVIAGTVLRNEAQSDGDYYNGLVAFGAEQGAYAKQRLVPFGEYVPWETQLRGVMQLFDLPMSQFRLPSFEQDLLLSQTTPVAGNICYEIAYAGLVAKQAKYAQLIVTVSNDSWFGDTMAPWQHLQMAQMRALENGRPVARATNSGISALIDHRGRLVTQMPQFVEAQTTGNLQLRHGRTPFNYLVAR